MAGTHQDHPILSLSLHVADAIKELKTFDKKEEEKKEEENSESSNWVPTHFSPRKPPVLAKRKAVFRLKDFKKCVKEGSLYEFNEGLKILLESEIMQENKDIHTKLNAIQIKIEKYVTSIIEIDVPPALLITLAYICMNYSEADLFSATRIKHHANIYLQGLRLLESFEEPYSEYVIDVIGRAVKYHYTEAKEKYVKKIAQAQLTKEQVEVLMNVQHDDSRKPILIMTEQEQALGAGHFKYLKEISACGGKSAKLAEKYFNSLKSEIEENIPVISLRSQMRHGATIG